MRKKFCVKLNKGLKSLHLPLGYLAVFVYAGIEPDKETRNEVSDGIDCPGDLLEVLAHDAIVAVFLYNIVILCDLGVFPTGW